MLKILYAAGNNDNSKITLDRFIQHLSGAQVKIAAYRKSSPSHISIDWTLDCLLNMNRPDYYSIEDNDNYNTYYQQVKYFNPDLIISDLEYFTSCVANSLNIKLWQCSPSLISYALTPDEKYDTGLFKTYSYVTSRSFTFNQKIINIIDNSDLNFVYSHLGDFLPPPKLKSNFQWIRPYHKTGKTTIPCKHNIVAGVTSGNKKIFNILQKYSDSVIFVNFKGEHYDNLLLKSISDQQEFYCNLYNSRLFLCEGQTSFLADAYYNGKYSVVIPNFSDLECIINANISEKMGYSTCIFDETRDLHELMDVSVTTSYNDNIKFLHDKLEEV